MKKNSQSKIALVALVAIALLVIMFMMKKQDSESSVVEANPAGRESSELLDTGEQDFWQPLVDAVPPMLEKNVAPGEENLKQITTSFSGLIRTGDLSTLTKDSVLNWLRESGFEVNQTSTGMTETGTRLLVETRNPRGQILNIRVQMAGSSEDALEVHGIWILSQSGSNAFEDLKNSVGATLGENWQVSPYSTETKVSQNHQRWQSKSGFDVTLTQHSAENPPRVGDDLDAVLLAVQPGH